MRHFQDPPVVWTKLDGVKLFLLIVLLFLIGLAVYGLITQSLVIVVFSGLIGNIIVKCF